MNNAASPRKETTRLSALATGLRLITTAAPKISVINAKTQNRNGDIIDCGLRIETRSLPTSLAADPCGFSFCLADPIGSAADRGKKASLLFLVPFQHNAVHDSADFEQFLLMVHHLCTREPCDGIIFTQKNRLLGADLFTHAAKDAADHVDIERLRIFLDLGEVICRRDFTGNNFNRAWRTDEFAELACDATHTSVLIAHQRWRAAIVLRQMAVPLLLGILHGNF